MSKGYTKKARDESRQMFLNHHSPTMTIEKGRMYLTQKFIDGGEVKVDATGLYFFLKEMFTTDWKTDTKKKLTKGTN